MWRCIIDAGTLEDGVASKGGHRKVPKASVQRWIAQNTPAEDTDKNYKKAAAEAGMYSIFDDEYVKACGRKKARAG